MSAPLWTCDDLILACNGELFDPSLASAPISGIKLTAASVVTVIFVALAGDKQDGHDFCSKQ